MATLGDLIVKVGADLSGFLDGMDSVIGQMDKVGDKVESRLDSIANVGQRLAMFGAELTAAVTLPIEEMGRRALDTAAQFEQTQMAFTTFMGSASAANSMLGELYQFAATTPFEVPTVLGGARQLMALGFAAKDVVPVLRTVGDAAAGLGLGQDKLQLLLFHLGQIKSEGFLDKRVLNEMGQNGIAAGQMIADGIGKSLPDTLGMIHKKQIDATTAINALLAGMTGQFGGMMQNQMQTFSGQLSNFKDQITLTMVDIGNTLLPIGKQVLAWAADAMATIKELAQWFVTLPAPVQAFAMALLAIAAAAGPVLAGLGGIGILLPGIMAAVTPLATVLGISVAALGWWAVAIAAALAALAALGAWVFTHWAGVQAALETAFEGLKEIWQVTIGEPLQMLIELFQWVYSMTAPIWDAIGSVLTTTWGAIKEEALSFWHFLKDEIFGPMFAMLQQVPGIGKLLSVGDAFHAADAKDQQDKSDKSKLEAAESTLHLGSHATKIPTLTGAEEVFNDKHKRQVEEYTKAVKNIDDLFAAHKVKVEEVTEAHKKLDDLLKQKYHPMESEGGKDKHHGPDRNALAGLSGENAHAEALFALRRGAVAQEYEQAQPSFSQKAGMSPEAIADVEIEAAARRRQELVAIAGDELKATLKTLDDKLKLYKSDENGYQTLIEAKKKAQDKYVAEVQKATFQEQDVRKRAEEQIAAETLRRHDQELKEEKRHVDALAQVRSTIAETVKRHEDAMNNMRDKRLQYELETGELSKAQYLRIKQDELDEAYQLEVAALEQERDLMEKEFGDLLSQAKTPQDRQRIMDDYNSRSAKLTGKRTQADDRYASDKQGVGIEQDKNQYNSIFKPIETSLGSGIKGLIEGTKTFKQAWGDMTKSMLDTWITSLSQMAAKWIAHKAMQLLLHVGTNQAMVASDAATSAEANSISLTQHLREIARSAAQAAAKTWAAVSAIPVVGPILAPIAAAAAFTGVMALGAISAEHGAVLPNQDTIAFLHPREMVLPSHLSTGLQNMIANGGMVPSASAMHGFLGSGAPNAQTASLLSAAASSGDTHHNWGGVQITMHNSAREPLTPDGIYGMLQQAVRGRNLKMA